MNQPKASKLLTGFFLLFSPALTFASKTSLSIIDNSHQSKVFSVNQALKVPALAAGEPVVSPMGYDIVAFISEAKSKLDIEIYEARDIRVQNAIFAALKRGVRVRIVAEPDPVGNGCDAFSRYDSHKNHDCEQSAQFTQNFEKLAKQQGERGTGASRILYFNKKLCWNPIEGKESFCFQHGKMLLRDDDFVSLSTGNLNPSSICSDDFRNSNTCNRDYTVVVKDEKVVKALRAIFELDFAEASGCDLPPKKPRVNNVVRQLTEGRCHVDEKEVDALAHQEKITNILKQTDLSNTITVSPVSRNSLESFLRSARKSIKIQAQYLRQPEWQEVLKDALERGVTVQTTLASFCHFNQKKGVGLIEEKTLIGENGYLTKWLNPLITGPNKMNLRVFNKSLPTYEKAKLAYQHAKIFLVDGKRAWIGSTNGSSMSTDMNREFGIFIDDPKAVAYVSSLLDKDFKAGISLEQHIPYMEPIEGDHRYYPVGSCKVYRRPTPAIEEVED